MGSEDNRNVLTQKDMECLRKQSRIAIKQLEIDCNIDTSEIIDTKSMNGCFAEYADENECAVDLIRALRNDS